MPLLPPSSIPLGKILYQMILLYKQHPALQFLDGQLLDMFQEPLLALLSSLKPLLLIPDRRLD